LKNIVPFLAMFLLALSGAAGAVTIDFDDVPEGTESTAYVSGGYVFAGDARGVLYHTDGQTCIPACASNGTRTLLAAGSLFGFTDQITMTRLGGGTFTLTAIDAGEAISEVAFAEFSAAQIDYIGFLGGVAVITGSFVLDGIIDGPGDLNDFQSFGINGVLADMFVFTGFGGSGGNNGFSLDNLTIQEATVPEPATLALALLGLLGIGVRRRGG
jgi:hypothetical protein